MPTDNIMPRINESAPIPFSEDCSAPPELIYDLCGSHGRPMPPDMHPQYAPYSERHAAALKLWREILDYVDEFRYGMHNMPAIIKINEGNSHIIQKLL